MSPTRLKVFAALETRNFSLVWEILEHVRASSQGMYRSLLQDIRSSYY